MSIPWSGRLVDLFILAPMQFMVSSYIKRDWVRWTMRSIGILNFMFNLHNYLHIDLEAFEDPLALFAPFMTKERGKIQLVRLFNLVVMYPFFCYVAMTTEMPRWLLLLLILDIVGGFAYNLYWFMQYYRTH